MLLLLPMLDVAFVSLVGADPGHVQKQLTMILEDHKAVATKVATADAAALARHDDRATDIVKALHVDGLVSSAIVVANGHKTLRVTIYDADGNMRSMSETQLTGKSLASGDLEVLHDNLGDEIGGLLAKAAKKKPQQVAHKPEPKKPDAKKPEPKAKSGSEIELDEDPIAKTPAKSKPAKPAPAKVATEPTTQASDDDDDPLSKSKAKRSRPASSKPPKASEVGMAPTTPEPRGLDASPDATTHDAAPTETASISADEIEAMTGGGADADLSSTASSGTPTERALHIQAGVGFGVTSRNFAPGPSTIAAYTTSPVGAIRLDGRAEPMANLSLGISYEHSLGLTSDLKNEDASTSITRWEASATYAVTHGTVEIAPVAGFGRRGFAIDSSDPSRAPDNAYEYAILGATATGHLGARVTLVGTLAFEPVVGGTDGMASELGSASRWAVDAGAGVDVRLASFLYVRALADYQRFSWSWDMAGARGAGGASDSYPSATLQLGARY